MRDRRRVTEATAVAALLGGLPSSLGAFRRDRSVRSVAGYLHDTTCAIGTLVPPGRPGFIRGSVAHLGISIICGEVLARTLPQRQPALWGAGAGLAIGVVNVGLIGRRFAAIRALPLLPQLADNAAFGLVFALVLDR